MNIDLTLLRSFLAVVDCRGFSAAAQTLGLTQAAVSVQIKRLEEQLHAPLFTRTSRSVTLTEAGGTLLPYARRIIHLQELAEASVGDRPGRSATRLGISEEQADRFLPSVLPMFVQRFPEARLELTCASSPSIVQKFREGELDIVVSIRHDQGISGEVIGMQPIAWVGSTGFELDPSARVPLACSPEGCFYRAAAQESLSRAGRTWRIMCTSLSPVGINAAVRAGLAVCVKAEQSVPNGCRILSESDAFPPLVPAVVELHTATHALTAEGELFRQLLVDSVRRDLDRGPSFGSPSQPKRQR